MLPLGSLGLFSIDHVFSQAPLLDSGAFLAAARTRGYDLSLASLEKLVKLGLLAPLFRVDDQEIPGRAIDTSAHESTWLAHYGQTGRLRDPWQEGQSEWWPLLRPDDESNDWDDGYYFSPWQLLEIRYALSALRSRPWNIARHADAVNHARGRRAETLALAALTDAYLPQIIGKVSYRSGIDRREVDRARYNIPAIARLAAVGYPAARLRKPAEFWLSSAHSSDPMIEWWPLVRHSDHNGWFKTQGLVLDAIWKRIAAEIFLRAHEDLSSEGQLEALSPESSVSNVWVPLLDRIGRRSDRRPTLDRALGQLSLSPQPRVILVVEGHTERLHVEALLERLGMLGAGRVRVYLQGTSSDKPNQLARLLAPRLTDAAADRFIVDGAPTALLIAMDPEGSWRTEEQRDRARRSLQKAIQEEVIRQGASLSQDELDILVDVRTWGEHTYELANFSDDEIYEGVGRVLGVRGDQFENEELRLAIKHVRSAKLDLKVVFDRLRVPQLKGELARELLPVVLAKADDPSGSALAGAQVPVVKLALDAYRLVQRLTAPGFSLQAPANITAE